MFLYWEIPNDGGGREVYYHNSPMPGPVQVTSLHELLVPSLGFTLHLKITDSTTWSNFNREIMNQLNRLGLTLQDNRLSLKLGTLQKLDDDSYLAGRVSLSPRRLAYYSSLRSMIEEWRQDVLEQLSEQGDQAEDDPSHHPSQYENPQNSKPAKRLRPWSALGPSQRGDGSDLRSRCF